MLTLESVNAHYSGLQVLRKVSLNVKENQLVTLLGANGAGKSTTLKAIAGLHRPIDGTIQFLGNPIERSSPHRIVGQGISLVPESRELFTGLDVYENLELGAYGKRGAEAFKRQLEWVINLFPKLAERLGQRAVSLSGGEQQMLAIARALMARPKLLLLDEPSLGLAPFLVDELFDVLERLNRQRITILLVEQNARRALEISHFGYVIENGRIVASGPPEDLSKDESIQNAYLGAI